MKVTDRRKKEKLKLDQMMRVLFRLSKRLTVQLISGLFGEQFTTEDVKSIHYGNAEFILDEYERIVGDLFLKLDTRRGLFQYHVEFQMLNDQSMVIRMFRYGFEKALELATGSEDNGLPLLAFPRQIVIFLEENEAIGEELAFRMRLPDGTETVYTVPVLRYWTLSPRDLQERRLFALLPLQVFGSRKNMRLIAASTRTDDEKRQLFTREFARLKETIGETLDVIRDLHQQRLLPTGDMDRILQVLGNILNYLYRHYGEYKQTEEEVRRMFKTYIPEAMKKGEKKAKIKVARNLLKMGLDVGMIAKATELTPEEVTSLQKKKSSVQ